MATYNVTVRSIVEQTVNVEADGPLDAKRRVQAAQDEGYGPQYAGDLSTNPDWRRWWVAWDVAAEEAEYA